ncbi:MAG: cupin domain-containing protein, partial [Proteobacteria bacterium]|nr:cupin domain-containing protein [Pseudomonadota bacterium]
MTSAGINADFSRLAIVHTAAMEWQASPSPSVWRKRLEGVFSDVHGDYPAGTYLLNPEGFSHGPFSEHG